MFQIDSRPPSHKFTLQFPFTPIFHSLYVHILIPTLSSISFLSTQQKLSVVHWSGVVAVNNATTRVEDRIIIS